MRKLVYLLLSASFVVSPLYRSISVTDHQRMGAFSSVDPPRNLLSKLSFTPFFNVPDLLEESKKSPIILIRYNGYKCLHCAEQLLLLKKLTTSLKKSGIRVFAFSTDTESESYSFWTKNGFDSSVFTFLSDTDNSFGKHIGAVYQKDGETVQNHVALVISKGDIRFVNYGEEPFMNVKLLYDRAYNEVLHSSLQKNEQENPLAAESGDYEIKTIAQYPEVINPTDLAFNTDKFRKNELWVVTGTDQAGEGVAIIRNPAESSQKIEKRRDYAASHFMWRTHAIEFGMNGTFGTAQNGEPNNDFTVPQADFMGPTLWASDTAIFARRNQGAFDQVEQRLASHLDMLHQSPFTMGIAHEKDNVYWVNDNMYNDICRYDFADPHEIGGTDHRDGIVKRYSEIKLKKREHNVPSHMVIDKNTNWLYFIDENVIRRLNTLTGTVKRSLQVQPPRDENLREFVEMENVVHEKFITTGLKQPVGIALYNDLLAVSDRSDGKIYVYNISSKNAVLFRTIETEAKGIAGIEFDNSGNLYYVDQIESTVKKVIFNEILHFSTEHEFYIVNSSQQIKFFCSNPSSAPIEVAFSVSKKSLKPDEWVVNGNESPYILQPGEKIEFTFDVSINGKEGVGNLVVQCSAKSGEFVNNFEKTIRVVSQNNKKIIVEDASREYYQLAPDVAKTEKKNYVTLTTDEFLQTYKTNSSLETVVWNVGTHGFVSNLHSAVMNELQSESIELMLIGDDPITLYAREGNGKQMLSLFGAVYSSVDAADGSGDDGKRVWKPTGNSPIVKNVQEINVQLPILYHYLGKGVIPVPNLSVTSADAKAFIADNDNVKKVRAIQREYKSTRNVFLGFNVENIKDTNQRRVLLENAITWLESIPTAAVNETPVKEEQPFSVTLSSQGEMLTVNSLMPISISSVSVFNVQGRKILDREYNNGNEQSGSLSLSIDTISNGVYFVLITTNDTAYIVKFIK